MGAVLTIEGKGLGANLRIQGWVRLIHAWWRTCCGLQLDWHGKVRRSKGESTAWNKEQCPQGFMCSTTHNNVLRNQIRVLFVFFFPPGVKLVNNRTLLSPLLSILITSVWLRQAGFSQLFRATQKTLIGNHSTLLTEGSTAPTLTIASNWGHSVSRYCSLVSAHIQSNHAHKGT